MAVSGAQEFWVAGARVFIVRDAIGGVIQPLLDFGVITEVEPAVETEQATLRDPDGGILKKVDEVTISFEETYNLTVANFSPDNLNILFAGDGVQSFSQVATPLTSVVHANQTPGKLVKLVNAAGTWMYGITSVEAVKGPSGTPVYVEDTDWEIVDLERGVIRMIDGGAFAAQANLEIDFTPRAISGNRLVRPQAGAASFNGRVALFIGRAEKAEQHVREMRCSITTESFAVPAEEHSSWVARFSVVEDATSVAEPFGRMLHFVGSVPATS